MFIATTTKKDAGLLEGDEAKACSPEKILKKMMQFGAF